MRPSQGRRISWEAWMNPTTVPELFAMARGIEPRRGYHRCFYCLAACGVQNQTVEYLRDSFTGRDTVGGGEFVCDGCVEAMREKATIKFWTGETRENQKVRSYSWVMTRQDAVAASKTHRAWLREKCLAPPEPPYAICLSDSGQKHLLYRGLVGWSQDPASVTLEGERIVYGVAALRDRLRLVTRLVAAVGRPGVEERLGIREAVRIVEYHGHDDDVRAWAEVSGQPLSRLALWLAPNKEEASIEYPRTGDDRGTDDRAVPAETGGALGPAGHGGG